MEKMMINDERSLNWSVTLAMVESLGQFACIEGEKRRGAERNLWRREMK